MDREPNESDDDLVITPGGPVRRSSTHRVPPGGEVRQEADGSFTVVGPPASPMPQGSTPMPDNLVLTPGGYRDPALVHHVATDTVVDASEGRLRQLSNAGAVLADHGPALVRAAGRPLQPLNIHVPAPAEGVVPAFGSGWITYASWTNSTGSPVHPVRDDLARPAGSGHVERPDDLPVQRDPELDDDLPARPAVGAVRGRRRGLLGGRELVRRRPDAATPSTRARYASTSATSLTGVMTQTGTSGALHSYSCEFVGIANTTLAISNVEELTWCIQTLEAYCITAATDYPNTFSTPDDRASTSRRARPTRR